MRPRFAVLRLTLLGLLAQSPSFAQAQWPNGLTVDQTPHNLVRPASSPNGDMVGRIRNFGGICVYCHTPHGGPSWLAGPQSPLVNRTRPNAAYRMPQFNGQQMIQDASPSDRSRVCLSCHGGTNGLDAITNLPNTYTGPAPANSTIDDCEGCHSGGNPEGGIDWEGVWFREDMRNQHPISVVYDPSRRPGAFKAPIGGAINGLPLWDGKVECSTCHEPHSQRYKYFLRAPNVSGSFCLLCHNSAPGAPVHSN